VAVAVFETGQIATGDLYLAALDHPDGTTLLMLCGLVLAALAAFRRCTDLQAVSFALVTALSAVIAYEALYKWSFFLAPFGRGMPPPELRELLLQLAVAATVLTGFAHHHLAVRRATWGWLAVLGAGWALWLLTGFPQLDGRVVHPQVLPWELGRDQVYLVNRGTKAALFLAYATLLVPDRGGAGQVDVRDGRPGAP
jgi:hypothetical protein